MILVAKMATMEVTSTSPAIIDATIVIGINFMVVTPVNALYLLIPTLHDNEAVAVVAAQIDITRLDRPLVHVEGRDHHHHQVHHPLEAAARREADPLAVEDEVPSLLIPGMFIGHCPVLRSVLGISIEFKGNHVVRERVWTVI